MLGRKNIDATKGPILRLIILYCIPLIIGTLIQTLFNAIDVAILGNMADSTSVASVGATTAIFHLLVHGFVGIASGLKILLARYIGAQDSKRILDSVGTSLIFSLVFGKEFLTFKRFADGETVSQNSRLENLMGRLGLMERLVDAESLSFPDTVLDHTSIRNEMDVMRRDSIRYLKESLEV